MKNALSIDVEDWYQGIIQIPYKDWHRYESRIQQSLMTVLDVLFKNNTKATFFILGHLAEEFPDLVKRIQDRDHEIASHGYHHRLVSKQTREEFYADVSTSKDVLESISGEKILGYRAPCFSVTKQTAWVYDILKDLGFKYDSSVFPTKNFLYGIPDAPQQPYAIDDSGFMEYPLSVVKPLGLTLPFCGGFYSRVLPYWVTKACLKSFNHKLGPAVIYMHPWEFDSDKPKLPMAWKWRFIHEYNTHTMKPKLEKLLRDFSFTTISEVLSDQTTRSRRSATL